MAAHIEVRHEHPAMLLLPTTICYLDKLSRQKWYGGAQGATGIYGWGMSTASRLRQFYIECDTAPGSKNIFHRTER
jgi:hypothetical protein